MRITIVGDTLLDEDIDGVSTRVCPDAPVPVIEVRNRLRRAGGAGLVATMLAHDGHDVSLVTALSDDEASDHIRDHLPGVEIIEGRLNARTPVKSRLRMNGEPMGRIDDACGPPEPPQVHSDMLQAIARAEVIIVSDYGRGLTSDPLIREILTERALAVPLVWDPHPRGAEPIPFAQLVTPNLSEACGSVGLETHPENAEYAGGILQERYRAVGLAVTLGERGALLVEERTAARRAPAREILVGDPCGAGDRFAASAAVALGAGASRFEAVQEAVDACGRYLASGGVTTLTRNIHSSNITSIKGDSTCRKPSPVPSAASSSLEVPQVWAAQSLTR